MPVPLEGSITTEFTVCCTVCKKHESVVAESKDIFIRAIDDVWRLTVGQGWVHKKCCKMMPAGIKVVLPPVDSPFTQA